LNPHGLPRRNLNPVRLPIPPLELALGERRDSARRSARLLKVGPPFIRRSRLLGSRRGGRRRPCRHGCAGRCARRRRSFGSHRRARLRSRSGDCGRNRQCRGSNSVNDRRARGLGVLGRSPRSGCRRRPSPERARHSSPNPRENAQRAREPSNLRFFPPPVDPQAPRRIG